MASKRVVNLDETIAYYETLLKKHEHHVCVLFGVDNQRELLLAYHKFYLKWRSSVSDSSPEYVVDAFLSKQ